MPAGYKQPVKTAAIREDILRDARHPVSRIADQLLPYLQVLVDQFHPEQVILFGSYAYGHPDQHSDVDLLIIKEDASSPLKQRIAIREAWWKMPRQHPLLPFDLIVVSPERHRERLANAAGFYDCIANKGLPLI